MPSTRIVGTASYLPAHVVSNQEAGRLLRLDADAVYRRTGIRSRRWAADGEASSDLAAHAARAACEAAEISPDSLEAILISTTSPDTIFPSTACHVQRRLGCRNAAAFDLAASCSGFLYGLSMADAFIRSGQYRRCLVVAAEVKSRFLDPADEATAIVFGDGAGAAVLTADSGATGPLAQGVMGVRLFADGTRHELIHMEAGGSRRPVTTQTVHDNLHVLRMRGGPLFRVAVKRLAGAVAEILKEFGVGIEQIGYAIFHQANARLMAAVARRLGLPSEKVYSVIDRFGNTSSASLPIALDHAVREGRIRRGDVILLGTFGGGLTWATALVRW